MIYDVQKAGLLKRFSAFLLDIILLGVLTSGFAFLFAWLMDIDGYTESLKAYYEQYEEKYGVDFGISVEDYNKLTQEEKDHYNKAWDAMFRENPDAYKAYRMTSLLPMLITTISVLLSYLALEFVVPLCLKNGQTVGKKVFGLGVVFNNSVRLTNFALFTRSIFGKYTLETMFPVLLIMLMLYGQMSVLLALILVAALLVLQIVLLIVTKTNSFVHDILANTVVVDLSSQMIFDTTQELISYQEETAKQEATKD